MNSKTLSTAIIGGGIGGLSAALSLLRAGFDVQIYEQVEALREIGAGIVLTPNATRVLHGLGFRDHLQKLGVAPDAWRQRRWQDGRTLLLGQVGQMRGPDRERTFFTSHRADILSMLRDAVPRQCLQLGHRLTSFIDHGDQVALRFANGVQAKADILIGADGIHSTVRNLLLGNERPQFTGCIAYRGLVPIERLEHLHLPNESQLWLGHGRHFVHYPVSGGRLINFVCLIDQAEWAAESWTEPGNPANALAAYAGWHHQVRSIIGAVEDTFVWGLFDREPLSRWSFGRITLLGDAAHPMLPFLAQGAAQAIEDGATLAALLASGTEPLDALRRYEQLRQPRTAAIQVAARVNKMRNHLPDGAEQRARDAAMATGQAQWAIGTSDWVYDYDAIEAAHTGTLGLPA
jgi:salicylate hydroxylase